MEDPIAVLRHNILGELTVIKNAIAFVVAGSAGEIPPDAKKFLDEAYKRNEQVIAMVLATREKSQESGSSLGGKDNV